MSVSLQLMKSVLMETLVSEPKAFFQVSIFFKDFCFELPLGRMSFSDSTPRKTWL